MAFVHYAHAEIDRRHPRALACCDRCGYVYNHSALRWQYDWMGGKIANLRLLVCRTCMDNLQDQRRQITLPRDPIPIEQPRVEPAIVELGLQPAGTVPYPYGTLAAPSNTTKLANLTNPVPPDATDPTAANAGATPPSSYFSIQQDLGTNR